MLNNVIFERFRKGEGGGGWVVNSFLSGHVNLSYAWNLPGGGRGEGRKEGTS